MKKEIEMQNENTKIKRIIKKQPNCSDLIRVFQTIVLKCRWQTEDTKLPWVRPAESNLFIDVVLVASFIVTTLVSSKS